MGRRAGPARASRPPPCPGHFQHLLNASEQALQDTFPGAFGELYAQSAKAFRDLYADLRLYYRGAHLHLEDTLAEFWARLLERLFRQLHPHLLLPDEYLDCLGKQAEALRPFGDAPRELRLRAPRAFVAARAFVQGLGVAGDVVRKVAQVCTAARALGPPSGPPSVQSLPWPGWVREGREERRAQGRTLSPLPDQRPRAGAMCAGGWDGARGCLAPLGSPWHTRR